MYLVRHGRTVWNKELIFRGRADVPLDDMGKRQAECAAQALRSVELAAVYSSPLSRAMETAEAIARYQKAPAEADPALIDLDCGKFEGLTLDAARRAFPDVYRLWETAPDRVRFPGGGGLEDVTRSVAPRLEELARKHEGQAIALVTHRVVLKVILCQVQWGDNAHFWDVKLDPASISLVEGEGGRLRVAFQNDTKHLAAVEGGRAGADF